MSLCVWRGDAQGIAQVDQVTVDEVEIGDSFTLTINRKAVSFTATTASAEHVYSGLSAAISAASLPEFPTATFVPADLHQASSLKLTGRADGTPFTISGSTSNGGQGSVEVELLQNGQPGRNMKQRISLPAGISGGTFTLSWSGQTTTPLDFDATAAEVESALIALTNIGSGNILVTGDAAGPWVVEFTATLGQTTQPPLSGNGASLTGQAVSVTQIQAGQSGSNYAGNFVVQYNSSFDFSSGVQITGTDPYGNIRTETTNYFYGEPSMWKNAIGAALGVGNASIAVTIADNSESSAYDIDYTISFECLGILAGQANIDLDLGWVTNNALIPLNVTDTGGNLRNEKQLVTLPGSPTGGTFTLTFQGQTTSNIAFDASASTVQAELEALANVSSGDVVVTAGSVSGWLIEFIQNLGSQDLALLTGSGVNLAGGQLAVSITQAAIEPRNEQVLITLGEEVSGGTFTLSHAGHTTSDLAYDATSATVAAALAALSHLANGDIQVSGNPGGPWTIEFTGSQAATNVSSVSANGDNLTGTSTQTITITSLISPTGPFHWDNADNWSGGSVPGNGDTVVLEQTANPVKYALNQSSLTLALLDIRASYTGTIGLASENRDGNSPYIEYRPRSLNIGANEVRIGAGEGSGSARIRLNLGSVASNITVFSTATPAATGQYAVSLQGTHANNKLFVYQGVVSIAPQSGESAQFGELSVGYEDDPASDVELFLGENVTLGDVVIHGGRITAEGLSGSAISSLLVTAGEVFLLGTDGVEQLDIAGGVLFYRTTGTLAGNTVVSGDGRLSLVGDLRAKTITNTVTCRGDNATIEDPHHTAASLSIAYESTTRLPELGTNFTIARS
ncbi:hypothetical protein DTL42_18265 [Bremerella cremea]|uniref:Uncharacterized protein n=1 Tax=Bremerella cremea TaxID=1031537 RepID=A0A368KR79_9BACT|nr:hypothetical protein [Bremerella cremea]RCS43931.1 hypothetical protein DTL42_18265 [Bremerella cremea]